MKQRRARHELTAKLHCIIHSARHRGHDDVRALLARLRHVGWPQCAVRFCLWSISALLSAVGFLNLTFKLIFDETSDEVHTWTILPYSLFLFASALYMPFASNKYILSTLFVLLAAAVSACVLVYASSLLYGWGADTVLVLFLAVHCTVVDLCYWGSTWVNQLREI
jgi:hypothetical protein